MDGKMPHILCTKDDIGEIVLLPGDPGRVAMFRDMLDDFKIVSQNREYTVGTGFYEGVKITVCSTGIGAPSTEIAVIQLIKGADPYRRDRRHERRCALRRHGVKYGRCPHGRLVLLLCTGGIPGHRFF